MPSQHFEKHDHERLELCRLGNVCGGRLPVYDVYFVRGGPKSVDGRRPCLRVKDSPCAADADDGAVRIPWKIDASRTKTPGNSVDARRLLIPGVDVLASVKGKSRNGGGTKEQESLMKSYYSFFFSPF